MSLKTPAALIVAALCLLSPVLGQKDITPEYPPYDGWFNNFAHPDWGSIDQPMLRRLPPAYADGSYAPSGPNRPNPLEISDAIMNGTAGLPSFGGRTALMVFFGQQVVEEILDAQRAGCPREYMNIKVPKNHRFNKKQEDDLEMPFLRSRYQMYNTGYSPNNPRQQLNEITPYIDGGLFYGVSKAWADLLRRHKHGHMAVDGDDHSSDSDALYENFHRMFPVRNDVRLPMANPPPPRDHYLKPVKRFFRLGNPRGNENPMLLAFGVLWVRYHNWWANKIRKDHPEYNDSDERIYNEARKMVIGIYQKIVVYDWLPNWLGDDQTPDYRGYDQAVDPQIAHVFQSAAMRFGHTLVTPGVYRRKPRNNTSEKCVSVLGSVVTHEEGKHAVRTCNSYWNPQEAVEEHDIESMLLGMAAQKAEREDRTIVPDLREAVFGPLEWSRRDLMAINIQRGRDHGLPDYNTARRYYNLSEFATIDEMNHTDLNPGELKKFRDVYGNKVDDIDIWAGGLLETTRDGPGELFRRIIRDQFDRIRHGDRFWFENKLSGLYSEADVALIRGINITDVILAVTNIKPWDIQANPFFLKSGDVCEGAFPQLSADNRTQLEECSDLFHFDYFSGSEVSYALTFVGLGIFTIGVVGLMLLLSKLRERTKARKRQQLVKTRSLKRQESGRNDVMDAIEWVDPKKDERSVRVKLDSTKHVLQVLPQRGNKPLRTIDFKLLLEAQTLEFQAASDNGSRMILVHIPKEYDLVLKFDTMDQRDYFIKLLEEFIAEVGLGRRRLEKPTKTILKNAFTHAKRQELLETFFKACFAHAFNIQAAGERDYVNMSTKDTKEVLACELTKTEFADALGMKPSAMFVDKMFELVDKGGNGYISFREFLDVIIIFHRGDAKEKMELLFQMYDVDHDGRMTQEDFKMMIRSLMELSNTDADTRNIDELIQTMFKKGNFGDSLTFEDFTKVLDDYADVLQYTKLNIKGQQAPANAASPAKDNAPSRARKTILRAFKESEAPGLANGAGKGRRTTAQQRLSVSPLDTADLPTQKSLEPSWLTSMMKWFENYHLHVFWGTLYTVVVFLVFAERAYYYSVEREHVGLRRIAGYGVTVTRGAASAMMLTYSSLLVTMCRNTITYLRQTFLHRFIPFDAAVDFHKYIAYLALFFTVIHSIGHAINFYHIAAQTADDLTCIFRDFYHATDELPKFHYWCFETITGLTGIFLFLVVVIIYVFAQNYARQHVFKWFWLTHTLYIVLYILAILHGSGRLVQAPFFHLFFLFPAILFIFDKLISISRNKVELTVWNSEHLPSDVTYLKFKRPANFDYLSGQWVRIACKKLGENEYHPFTLTSAPHEKHLSLHIRAVGPWTINLRRLFDRVKIGEHALPKIYLDGPFGEGHQDWYKFDVAVLVGGGIGVTPFASILKDISFKTQQARRIGCKKVYFLWVTKTQKQFEWLTDIIRDVERKDSRGIVSVHIFITELYNKFDLRSTMLYICERHFQKIAGRSLFTGLKSITHFGRPQFVEILRALGQEHPDVNRIGVFSCGPPPMTKDLDRACSALNGEDGATFQHHFENF